MIEFRMFGALQLTDAAGREVKSLITRPRRLALLAYLTVGQELRRRDSLLAMFWPELDQEHARAALRQALHVLRTALGADVVVTRGDDDIGIDPSLVWTDVVAFDRAVAEEQCAAALELYRGALLDGFFISGAADFERWLDEDRSRRQRDATQCARRLVEQAQVDGDLTAAIAWARHAVQLAPHDEDAVRQLMRLLDQFGDRAGAITVFEEFAKRVAADLDTEPAAETKALLAAIRARETAAPVELQSAGVQLATARHPRARRTTWLVATAVALGGLLLAALWPRPSTTAGRIRSLAVLPLANLSGDSLQASFADGMTEALITDLGRIAALRVTSRTAVMQFKGTAQPPAGVAHMLGVSAIIEGGVQRSGDRVRVDLRLIDAGSGYQLWARRIEASVGERFAIEDSVARSVAAALGVSLTPAQQRALRIPPTGSLEAYDLFLRGKIRLRHETRKDDSLAITLLERAVALDPDFAVAQATLAYAYSFRVAEFVPDDSASLENGLVAVEKALRLDPDLAEAHLARAHLLWGGTHQFAHAQAIQEDRRALELNANLDDAHHHLGYIYLHLGLLDEAIGEFRKTLAIDPSDWIAQQRIGVALIQQGRYEEALRVLREVPDSVSPRLWNYHVAWTLLYLERNDEASALIETYLRGHPGDPGGLVTSIRAILRAKTGDATGAEEDIRAGQEKGKRYVHFHHAAYNIAAAYALLHRPQAALVWLRRAADTGLPDYPLFAKDPNLDNIRGDPAFVAFMRDLKAQWERYRSLSTNAAGEVRR